MPSENTLFDVSIPSDGPMQLRLSGQVTGDQLRESGCDLVGLFGEEIYSRPLLIDMQKAEFLDSSGIGWLLEQHRRFRGGNGVVVLHSIPPMVSKVMQLMNLHRVLRIADDEKAAHLLVESNH